VDQIRRSALYNLEGSSDIILNTFSFGGADAIGLTESVQYEGAGFDAARISAGISREAAVGLVTGGSSVLASGTGAMARAAMAVNTGMRVVNAGRSGLAIGSGINRVASGDSGGWLDVGVGLLSVGTNIAGGTRLGGTLNTIGRTTQAGVSGYQIGTGIHKVRSGDSSGYADIATGSFGAVTSVLKYATVAPARKAGVVDKSWKNLIGGQAHGSGAHKFRTYREAIRMAKSGQYDRIYLNRSLRTATNGGVDSLMRPDVTGVLRNGRLDVIEVVSPSQTFRSQWLKVRGMEELLGDRAGAGSNVIIPH
jgi:hypothetical protein